MPASPRKPIVNERAVAVAKDVLKRLRLGKLRLSDNLYLTGDPEKLFKGQAKKHITKIEKVCEVCALGACLLSKIRLYNVIDTKDLRPESARDEDTELHIWREKTTEMLNDIFSPEQMDLIECAFEQSRSYCSTLEYDDPQVIAATRFGALYDNDADRLEAIMQNLIAHNGVFTPSVHNEQGASV